MQAKQSGFTLLEILVAMLVLSIGLLGLAGLMASSMRNNLSASHRTQASLLAYDIIDRMRANRTLAALTPAPLNYNTPMPAAVVCSAAPLTGLITAAKDIADWENQLACALPAGMGSIQVAAGKATVVIQWDDSRGTRNSDAASLLASQKFKFTVESQL